MKVATFNVNGIRAADRRGFRDWLARCDADVIALQEVRCRPVDLPDGVFGDYHLAYDAGELAGRNGVAVLTRQPPECVFTWSEGQTRPSHPSPAALRANPFAGEGRLIGVDLADAPLTVVSVYVPKGGLPQEVAPASGGREGYSPAQQEARYQHKLVFLRRFAAEMSTLRVMTEAQGRHLLVLGDYNIAHGPADLHNWRSNLAHEGFLPAERAWLDAAVGPESSSAKLAGRQILAPTMTWPPFIRPFVDVVRSLHPDDDGPYSWWSWMGQAFAKDVGWRIDYHLASPTLAATATKAWVDRADTDSERISDHAPVLVDYSL